MGSAKGTRFSARITAFVLRMRVNVLFPCALNVEALTDMIVIVIVISKTLKEPCASAYSRALRLISAVAQRVVLRS